MASAGQSPLPDPWDAHLRGELAEIDAQSLRRTILTPETGQGTRVRIGGRRLLNFTSNNYLGLATDARVVAGATEAARRYGAGAGAARLLCGSTPIHEELERRLAALKGQERALLYSAGYLANLGVITALAGKGDVVFSDALNHASIIDGCRLSGAQSVVYRHCDLDHLESLLSSTPAGRRLIVTETVFSMDGDIVPLPAMVDLAARYDALLVIDEAHATGVLGRDGAGAMSHFGLAGGPVLVVGTLSKALGSAGGFVTGPAIVIDYLVNRSRAFIFQTALPPPSVGAALGALDVMAADSGRIVSLDRLATRLRDGLLARGYPRTASETAIVPLVIGEAQAALDVEGRLRDAGILAKAIRPPTVPPGTSRIRFNVMATHTSADIDAVLAALPDPP